MVVEGRVIGVEGDSLRVSLEDGRVVECDAAMAIADDKEYVGLPVLKLTFPKLDAQAPLLPLHV